MARFIASAFAQKGQSPLIHVFDTFTGHPDFITPSLDGPHLKEDFGDTSYEAVDTFVNQVSPCQIWYMQAGQFILQKY